MQFLAHYREEKKKSLAPPEAAVKACRVSLASCGPARTTRSLGEAPSPPLALGQQSHRRGMPSHLGLLKPSASFKPAPPPAALKAAPGSSLLLAHSIHSEDSKCPALPEGSFFRF